MKLMRMYINSHPLLPGCDPKDRDVRARMMIAALIDRDVQIGRGGLGVEGGPALSVPHCYWLPAAAS